MLDESSRDFDRLGRAVDLFLGWQTEESRPDWDGFVEEHADLRDLLEDMRVEDSADGGGPALLHEQIGDYEIVREIGRGAMGIVYEGRQVALGRRVAVKVLRPDSLGSSRSIARLRREAALLARLDHPNVVSVFDYGTHGQLPYFVMEFVDGVPLNQVIEAAERIAGERGLRGCFAEALAELMPDGPAPGSGSGSTARDSVRATDARQGHAEVVAMIALQIADALHHAHEAGVVHRDVKPSNVIVRRSGDVVLTDFGLAREDGLPSVTRTGEFAGTPCYVAPECIRGPLENIDGRCDVFSVGVTLYELSTWTRPFDGETGQEVIQQILRREPPDPRRLQRELPADLAAITLKAMEKPPSLRYASSEEMAADLRAFLDRRPVRARPVTALRRVSRWVRREPFRAATVGAAALLLAVGAVVLINRPWIAAGSRALEAMRVDATLAAGFTEIAKGSPPRALRHFDAVLQREPDNVDAKVGRVLAYVVHLEPARALEVLEATPPAADPDTTRTLRRLRAIVLRALDRNDEAQRIAAELGDRRTEHEAFALGMEGLHRGHLTEATADYERARDELEKAMKLASTPRLHLYHQRAHVAGHLDDASDAEIIALALTERWPESAHAWYFAGIALKPFDRERTIECMRRAAELNQTAFVAQHFVRTLREFGHTDRALSVAEDQILIWPRYSGLLVEAGSLLLARGETDAGRAMLRRAVAITGHGALTRRNRGAVLRRLGDYARAREELNAEVEARPWDPLGWIELGLAYSRGGDWRGAAEALERGVERLPNSSQLHRRLGECYRRLQRYVESRASLERALELVPDEPNVLDVYSPRARSARRPGRSAQGLRAGARARPESPVRTEPARDVGRARR